MQCVFFVQEDLRPWSIDKAVHLPTQNETKGSEFESFRSKTMEIGKSFDLGDTMSENVWSNLNHSVRVHNWNNEIMCSF